MSYTYIHKRHKVSESGEYMIIKESELIKLFKDVEKTHPDEFNRVVGMMQGLLLAKKAKKRRKAS